MGLGNLWRFTYVAGSNGGGSFLIPYLIMLATFGVSFLLIEFAVGRYFRTSIIESLSKIKERFWIIGTFIVFVTSIILSYYLVIVGWILAFLFLYATGNTVNFDSFANSWHPILSFVAILAINFVIIQKGVHRGIERINKVGVFLLIAFLVPMTIWAVTLPGSAKGLQFFLTPTFSELLNPSIWTSAIGQVFFSVSGAQGILLAYGSYLKGRSKIIKNSAIIVTGNGIFSIVAGLMLFSVVFAFGMDPSVGLELLFETLPEVFTELPEGRFIGLAFFSLLSIAGITSSIALFQVPVSALEDTKKFSKNKAVTTVSIGLFAIGIFSALSYSHLELDVLGYRVLDVLDYAAGTYGLAIGSTVFIITITWFMDKKDLLYQINVNSKFQIPMNFLKIGRFVLPAITILIIISSVIGF